MKAEARINKQSTKSKMPRTGRTRERSVSRLRKEMEELGVDMSNTEEVGIRFYYIVLK